MENKEYSDSLAELRQFQLSLLRKKRKLEQVELAGTAFGELGVVLAFEEDEQWHGRGIVTVGDDRIVVEAIGFQHTFAATFADVLSLDVTGNDVVIQFIPSSDYLRWTFYLRSHHRDKFVGLIPIVERPDGFLSTNTRRRSLFHQEPDYDPTEWDYFK